MKCILGKKIGMVQLFQTDGTVVPATVVHCEPNRIVKVMKNSVQVGFDSVPVKKLNKAQAGVFRKLSCKKFFRQLHEFAGVTGYAVGQDMVVGQFHAGEFVDVQGKTKGRGFTGAIVRWNFKIGPLSHGAGYPHRYQGSIAMGRGGSQAQRVRKGQRMSGHYGNELVTIQNLEVLYVNERDHTITVKGAIPGPVNGIVFIKNSVKAPKDVAVREIITKANMEEIQMENEILQDKEAVKEQNAAIDAEAKAAEEKAKAEKEAAAVAKAEEEKAAAAAAANAAKEGK